MPNFESNRTVFIIDGSSFLYRAYYGLRPLYTLQGVPVQAVYSFCRMIKKLIDTFKPVYMVLVWDSKGKTERHALYADYKATRQEAPSDLFGQKELIKQFADLIALYQVERPGIEADDLMFSIARDVACTGKMAVLITSDKDMGQTLQENIQIFDPFKDTVIDVASFEAKMLFPVYKLPFYFALIGDTSDNIPGVKGIGPKGATLLVQQFQSLTDLYNNIDQVTKERTKQALLESKDNAFLSEKLFLLRYHDLKLSVQVYAFNGTHWGKARQFFAQLQFTSLLKDLEKTSEQQTSIPQDHLSKRSNYSFISVTTREQLQTLCAQLKQAEIIAIDTETSGLSAIDDLIIGISICMQKGISYYIPFGHHTNEDQLSKDEVITDLKPIFFDEKINKIMHHAHFDLLVLAACGMQVRGLIFDTMVAAHLITEDWQRIGLKYLSEYYLKEPMLSYNDVVLQNGYKNFESVPLALATEYAAADAHQTFQLMPLLRDELRKQKMEDLYGAIEFPLIAVLVDMHQRGIYLDLQELKQIDTVVSQDLKTLQASIRDLVGIHGDINLNSPKQLEILLFEKLHLPPQKKTSGKSGYSTDQEVLEHLATLHPVPGLILKYRELFKLKSTYIDALPEYINQRTHNIHTTFSQTAVATGRLASSHPNLQNIPLDSESYPDVHIRAVFKPKEGFVFLSADYSQIELRVLAHLSGDQRLIQAFLNHVDIHQQTASTLFDVPLDHVTHQQRQVGKRINFSILYGLTAFGLSKDLKIPFKDAKMYIEKYFAQYPGVSAWMEEIIKEAKKNGFVTTLYGRRRYVPGIYENNKTLYDLAKRISINTVAQGTAAEVMKLGMISIDKALKHIHADAHMILQIHDEIILQVPIGQESIIESVVKTILQDVVQWRVPLEVTTRIGSTWYEVSK